MIVSASLSPTRNCSRSAFNSTSAPLQLPSCACIAALAFPSEPHEALGSHLYRLYVVVEASSAQSKTRSSKGVVSASSCRFRTRAFRALSNELWTSSLATDHWQEECFSELIF